jgi:hypothetical protein
MRKSPVQFVQRALVALVSVVLASSASGAQGFTVNGTLTTSSPAFDSPNFGQPPASTAGLGNVFFFGASAFTVSQTGSYTFNSTASFGGASDVPPNSPALFVYANSFNPALPLQNVLAGASTISYLGSAVLPLTLTLQSSTSYVLVTSTFLEGDVGTFQSSCSPSANNPGGRCLLGGNTVVPEPSTILLSTSGLLALAFAARRRRSSRVLQG